MPFYLKSYSNEEGHGQHGILLQLAFMVDMVIHTSSVLETSGNLAALGRQYWGTAPFHGWLIHSHQQPVDETLRFGCRVVLFDWTLISWRQPGNLAAFYCGNSQLAFIAIADIIG